MERAAKCTLVLGFNGTGKTTFLRQLFLRMLSATQERGGRLKILIVTPDDTEWQGFPGKYSKLLMQFLRRSMLSTVRNKIASL